MDHRKQRDDVRVSLAPLTPEDALRALLAVKPDASPTEPHTDDDEAPTK